MSFGSRKNGRSLKLALVGSMAVLALLMVRAPQAQEAKHAAPAGGDIARERTSSTALPCVLRVILRVRQTGS